MRKVETIHDFFANYPEKGNYSSVIIDAESNHFNIFSRDNCAKTSSYIRRDYFKVSLIIGTGKLFYADKVISITQPALLLSNPKVPYAWETVSKEQSGWFCLFTEQFLYKGIRQNSLQDSSLFKIGSSPIIFLNHEQQNLFNSIYEKMMVEIATDYSHRYDLIQNLLYVLLHEAMKIQPSVEYEYYRNASKRITSLFLELLERQFPIDKYNSNLQMKTAKDYAYSLSIHVNSLNRSVKEVTGKTTTDLIASRIIQEAIILLRDTEWTIAEISYGLGFDNPSYFTNFFKKKTGRAPVYTRK